jgi:hypothetical protein
LQGSEKEERVRERGRCGGGSYCECNTRYWHTTALVMDIIFGRREESREKRERESREEGAAGVYFSSLRVHFSIFKLAGWAWVCSDGEQNWVARRL